MKIMMQLSMETKAIIDHLRGVTPGETVEYAKMKSALRLDVTGDARGALTSARRVLLREGVRFDVVRGVGLKRMTDSEIARSGAQSVRVVRAAAKRETAKMYALKDFESLTNEEKAQHNATLSVLGVVRHFSKPSQVAILEGAVAAAKAWLPPAETVEAMRLSLIAGKKK